ncbi:MAG: methyltransferase domain-containing protein [Caldilineae bacterium]|nr:MAG: methyltransferase domain-containing protein [Caldilineae bacterium]
MSMEREKIRRYFQHHARQFDRLYEGGVPGWRWFNRLVRQPFYRRFALTMAACGDVQGMRVLDVGCGSGRYAVALAQRGATVVGVDFAPRMLALASRHAQQAGVAGRCHFIAGDFLEVPFAGTFDILLAIGLFDYIASPLPVLEKMRALTGRKLLVTFVPPGGWRAFQRRIRYRWQGCPLYFYTPERMAAYFEAAGFRRWRFVGSWAEVFP